MTLKIDEENEHVPILMCIFQFPWRIARARATICKAGRNIWISRTKCSGHQDICAPQNLEKIIVLPSIKDDVLHYICKVFSFPVH
jgi:hypothetical protein